MAKFQVPTVGGLRKVIRPGSTASSGTTIAGLEGTTLTIQQLAALLANLENNGGGNIGQGTEGAIQVGPGLAGGGQLVGTVQIRLVAPIPAMLAEDGAEGERGPPGIPGPQGIQGPQGIPGTSGTGSGAAPVVIFPDYEQDDPPLGFNQPMPNPFMRGAGWSAATAIPPASAQPVDIIIPYGCRITGVFITTQGGAGNCAVDVWKTPFPGPPTGANDITGGAPPTIAGGTSYSNTTLSGWQTQCLANDVIRFTLASSSVFTTVEIQLRFQ